MLTRSPSGSLDLTEANPHQSIITLPKSIEDKLASLPQEGIEAALFRLAEEHGHGKERALANELQKGLNDLKNEQVTPISTKKEMDDFFRASRKRILAQTVEKHA